MELGKAASLPIIEDIGRTWTWVALPAWAAVFVAMCTSPVTSAVRWIRTYNDQSPAGG